MRTRFFAVSSFLLLSSLAFCQDDKPKAEAKAEATEAKTASAAEIDKLMEQLDSNLFSERQTAQQKLAEIGKAAIPALEKGTQNVSREVAVRSLDVLKGQYQKGDDATKAAAKEVFERLAKGNDATLAKRAAEVLSPAKPAPQIPQGAPGIVPGRIAAAQIQIQVAGGAGGNIRKMKVTEVNGIKSIEAEGDGKKVQITDDPTKGIHMEVIESKDGKETTQKYDAKDAAELKTKHPDAHKLYEEYTKQPAGIQLRVGGFPGGALPPGFPPPGVRPRIKILRPDDLEAAKNSADSALKELDSALKTLKDAKSGSDDLKKAQEQLEAAKKEVESLKAKLGE